LREWVLGRTRAQPVFLRLMAQNALQSRPALGMLGDFATENLSEAPHSINLKSGGVRPFVDAARIYALGRALPHTGTAERLRAAGEAAGTAPAETEALVAAFFFVQALRLRGQRRLGRGASPEAMNRLDPASLHEFDRRMLKEALRQARRLQQRLALDYNL
jgi:CBS domain-containing protein